MLGHCLAGEERGRLGEGQGQQRLIREMAVQGTRAAPVSQDLLCRLLGHGFGGPANTAEGRETTGHVLVFRGQEGPGAGPDSVDPLLPDLHPGRSL